MQAKAKMMQISETDRRAWEIVTGVPKMPQMVCYGCAAANIFIAGSGTIFCAFKTDDNLNKT